MTAMMHPGQPQLGMAVAPVGPAAAGMDLAGLATTLWRGKWILSALALVGVIAGLMWAFLVADPRYRATAVVVLGGAREQVVSFADFVPSFGTDPSVINTEIEVLRSTSLLAELADHEGLVGDPEFNRYLVPPSLAWRGISAFRRLIGAEPSLATPVAYRDVNATIAGLAAQLTVRNVPESMVIEVMIETSDADKSARLANALVDLYVRRQLDAKFAATDHAAQWLSEKVATLEIDLQAAEAKTNRFAAEMELISAETIEVLTAELGAVREAIAARQAALARGEATRNTAARIDDLLAQEAALSEKIGTGAEARVTLEQLQRESLASRQIYEYFLNRLKETTVQQGIQQADATLMSAALVPDLPSTPRPVLSAMVSAFLALAMGAALLVGREMRTATFRTAEDLEQATGLPVLGQIPRIPARRRQSVLAYVRKKPASAAVEAIRNLRTSLVMSGKTPPQVIVSTSSLPSEGKTTQTLALAQTFAGLGRRVLVIEGDLRKRVFRDYFAADNAGSLLPVLRGKQTLATAVWPNEALGFDILFGDDAGANAADLFSTNAFKRVIDEARRDYDVILIDTPPVLLVPDARVIGRLADAVLYTVRWDSTREKQVQAGLSAFRSVGIPVCGLVLSQINPRGMRRYGYGKDHGTYGGAGYYRN